MHVRPCLSQDSCHDRASSCSRHARCLLGDIPDNVPEVEVELGDQDSIHILPLLREAGLVQNGKAAKDVFGRGAVYLDGAQLSEERTFSRGDSHVIQAGKKKIARVTVK